MAYCEKCGCEIFEKANFCDSCGNKLQQIVNSDKDAFVENIAGFLNKQFPEISFIIGGKTDIELYYLLADIKWLLGWKKVEYKAKMRFEEEKQTIYFWETVKESGQGIQVPCFLRKTKFISDKNRLSGHLTENLQASLDEKSSYTWDYALIRDCLSKKITTYGWQIKTVILPNKAEY